MQQSTIKVLIVDDSALIRQMLARALAVDPRVEIVGTAKTGVEAIERARELCPDVITLDIEMPELTGLEALPHIRKHTTARVLMLSTLDDPDTTYQALSTGAVDFIPKPKGGFASSLNELSELLLKKIRTAYRIDPARIETLNASVRPPERPEAGAALCEPAAEEESVPGPSRGTERAALVSSVVAIAASTGGPPALERVFAGLSATLPASFLVVQHLPHGFSASLARRLSSVSEIDVVEAADGDRLEPCTAYLAPYGTHMRVVEPASGNYRIRLEDSPPIHGVRPAADPLFESVAQVFGARSVGVVLTGMGSDGAKGVMAIKGAGGDTIAQDEGTSVVWGMPGAAMRTGAVRHTVPIGLVAAEIRRVLRGELGA